MQFQALIEQDENGVFIASVPGFPGCYSDGRTESEARQNIVEALELWLEVKNDISVRELPAEQKQHVVSIAPGYIETAKAA